MVAVDRYKKQKEHHDRKGHFVTSRRCFEAWCRKCIANTSTAAEYSPRNA